MPGGAVPLWCLRPPESTSPLISPIFHPSLSKGYIPAPEVAETAGDMSGAYAHPLGRARFETRADGGRRTQGGKPIECLCPLNRNDRGFFPLKESCHDRQTQDIFPGAGTVPAKLEGHRSVDSRGHPE